MRRRIILIAAGGSFALLAVTILSAEPSLANAQLSADNRALALAARHQSTIDTALQQFLSRGSSGSSESDDRLLTLSSQNLAEYESARSVVDGDIASLANALEPHWLVAGAWGQTDQLKLARERTTTALGALQHANSVLSAAIDQERLQNGFFYAAVNEAKILTAVDDQQYVQIDGLYARADRALKVSETLMSKPDVPGGYKPVIVAMRSVLDETQKYGAALLRNDQAHAAAYHTAMRAGYANLAAATTDARVNGNDDWNDRTFQPLVAAYHSGLAAILS